jgi:hypothetical protein
MYRSTSPAYLATVISMNEVGINRQSIERQTMCWTAEELGFDSRQGQEIFIFSTVSRPALKLTRRPMEWVSGKYFP